jgi:muramidase (phage lysozyme)
VPKIVLPFASLLASPNVKAAIRVIREGETWNSRNPGDEEDEKAFRVRYHPTIYPCLFDGFDDHPRILEPLKDGSGRKSSAAGALQITMSTWDDMRARYEGIGPQFTPQEQLKCGVAIMHAEDALDDVIYGRFDAWLPKLATRWASLPNSPLQDGGRKLTYVHALATWKRFGGGELVVVAEAPPEAYTQPAATIEERSTQARPEDIERITAQEAPARPTDAATAPQEVDMGPLAILGLLFSAFQPFVQQKLNKALDKSGTDPAAKDVAANITARISEMVHQVAGIPQPPPGASEAEKVVALSQAVATVKADPVKVAALESQVAEYIDKMMPLIDRMHSMDKDRWQAARESQDAAAARSHSWPTGLLMLVAKFTECTTVLVVMLLGGVMVWQLSRGQLTEGVLTLAGAIFTQAMREKSKLTSAVFGSAPESEAAPAARDVLKAATKK